MQIRWIIEGVTQLEALSHARNFSKEIAYTEGTFTTLCILRPGFNLIIAMKAVKLVVFLSFFFHFAFSQTILVTGKQPQLAVDTKGIIRLVFGEKDRIFYVESKDSGSTFSKPMLVADVPEMHLGMTRGPQVASSADFTLVTAMDKSGNIYSFVMEHKTGRWERVGRVNDKTDSAPEGLMSITADDNNTFYAVWLDLRNEQKNNIAFASFANKKWSPNKFAYVSPEDQVCECCKPTISVKGTVVSIMFRNWLKGSRDLYVTTSTDRGATFSAAQKLGLGTWQLKGCPMDGGGISIDSKNGIHTAWQRDGIVYYAQPGKPEEKIGEGRHVALHGNIITWESGSSLMVKPIGTSARAVGEGTALATLQLREKSIFCAWEKDGKIFYTKLKG